MPSHPVSTRGTRKSPGRSGGKGRSKSGLRASSTGIKRSGKGRTRRAKR